MIENLKDLERLLKLCRKQGVTSIKLGTVELVLGVMGDPSLPDISEGPKDKLEGFPEDRMLSPEELMYWSAGGPENPNLKAPKTPEDA
jgi:hypothetical protein